jgi:hypothetical protein
MDQTYQAMLIGNKIQSSYFSSVVGRRNEYLDQAFTTPISTYFPHGSEERTPLELAYHAMTPLYKFARLLVDHQTKWDDLVIEPIGGRPSEQFLAIYAKTLEQVERALEQVEVEHLGGEFAQFREDEDTLKQRFGVFTMHAMQHMGQAIKLQGLISEELAATDEET